MKWMSLMLMFLATVTMATTIPEARVAVWAANNGLSTYTATFDGNRIVEVNGSAALAAAAAQVTDADAQAYIASHTPEPYPTPDSVVPLVKPDGAQIGTARIVVDATTMQPIAVVDSASPQKPWAEQRAAAVKKAAAIQKAKAGTSGQLQARIENIERVLGMRD